MIKLIVLDVDGCLSDGKLIYSQNSLESKNFNVKDGLGISTWIKMGNKVVVITGRKSTIVENRMKELGVEHIFQGIDNKEAVLNSLLLSLDISTNEIAAIGDDLNDYNMLKLAGKSFTPNNGVKEIKSIVDVVLTCDGGDGAVREMIDILVNENNQKKEFMSVWL